MKQLASLVLALALCAGLAVPALAAEFSDVPSDHPFYSAIMDCAGKGILGGYNDGTFQPSNTVTRSNFCVMLSRAFYGDKIAQYITESNLKYGKFMPNYVVLNYANALTNTSFSEIPQFIDVNVMNQSISRYDMAQLISNIMADKGFSVGDAEKAAAISSIADYGAIPGQYQEAVATVYALGVIGGYGDGSFGGKNAMTRGQAAIIIYRMTQYLGSSDSGSMQKPESLPPVEPETPAGTVLADGSAVTEENVMRLMEQARSGWGRKTWSGTPYPAGQNSQIRQAIDQYVDAKGGFCSTFSGCGGFAAYMSDAAFGKYSAGFPARKTTFENMRAGDIVIYLKNGKLTHVAIASGKTATGGYGEENVIFYGCYEASAGSVPRHDPHALCSIPGHGADYGQFGTPSTSIPDYTVEFWTRYPD